MRARRLSDRFALIFLGLWGLSLASFASADDQFATAEEMELMEGFPPPPGKQVTKANALLTAPFNRWSYLNMRMFYPSAPIPAADTPTALQKELMPSIASVSIEEPGADQPSSIDDFMKKTFGDALVVIHKDKIVYEDYRNGMSPDQPHQMMSVTKSFAGLLGLLAVDDGKISESDLVVDTVPELKTAEAFADATFGQVLDMTNSMNFTEVYSDPRSGIRQYGAVIGWTEKEDGIEYADSLYQYLATLPIDEDYEHGEIFHYQTPKTDVVNWVTNRVNNQAFEQTMYEKLWSKLGTEGETYILLDGNATLVAGGGLNATPYNLARFAAMMINDGKFDGQDVVSPAVIKTLSDGGDIAAFDNGPDSDGVIYPKGEWSYRAQWWVKHTEGMEAFMAIGIHGQWIYLDVNRKVAIVKQSSQPLSKDDYLNAFDLNAFYAIVRMFD